MRPTGYGPPPTCLRYPTSTGRSATARWPSGGLAERDIPEVLIAYQDDRELHLRMGVERPPSGAELGRLAERAEIDRAAGRAVTLTIIGRGSDVCLGR